MMRHQRKKIGAARNPCSAALYGFLMLLAKSP